MARRRQSRYTGPAERAQAAIIIDSVRPGSRNSTRELNVAEKQPEKKIAKKATMERLNIISRHFTHAEPERPPPPSFEANLVQAHGTLKQRIADGGPSALLRLLIELPT